MKVFIQMTKPAQLKALPILMRGTPYTVLPQGVYVIDDETAVKLTQAGVDYTTLSRESAAPTLQGVSGERV